MTAMQINNANALIQEIARIPEEKRDGYITAMRLLLLGEKLASNPAPDAGAVRAGDGRG